MRAMPKRSSSDLYSHIDLAESTHLQEDEPPVLNTSGNTWQTPRRLSSFKYPEVQAVHANFIAIKPNRHHRAVSQQMTHKPPSVRESEFIEYTPKYESSQFVLEKPT